MSVKPYIGITGPATLEEVAQVGEAFQNAGFTKESSHAPMIGILVSHKTLNRQTTENRRYPEYIKVPRLIQEASKFAIPMIHYNSKETNTLADQLAVLCVDSPYLEGIQLNIPWPDEAKLWPVKRMRPNLQFVIQLSHTAMQDLTPEAIANRIGDYSTVAAYTLIDPSGGRGKEFDLEKSVRLYQSIKGQVPHITIGFAGGFRGDNVALRLQTLKEKIKTKDFCIDAEGGLRDKITDSYGDDTLNMSKVKNYITQAAKVLL